MQNFHNDNDSKYPYGYIYLSITLIEYKYSYFVIKKAGDVLYRLILQRLASIVGILLVVTIGTFVLIKLSPIDPVSMKFNLVGATPDPVVVAQIREQLGLNDPWWQQYLRWLGQIVQGDFGESILYALPVATILGGALPNTLGVSILSSCYGDCSNNTSWYSICKISGFLDRSWYTSSNVLGLSYSWVLGRFIITVLIRC